MNTKLAILGKLQTKFYAPFFDKTWDIWSVNKHSDEKQIPRVDLWFDLHFEPYNKDAQISRQNFPFKEIDNLLGGHYFNNSISYLIAYAIYKGYKEIALYGMKFNTETEQKIKQYENVRELIFFAKGRGIKITAPEDSILLKEYPAYTKTYVENKPR